MNNYYKKTEYYVSLSCLLLVGMGGILIPDVKTFATGILVGYSLAFIAPGLMSFLAK